MCLYLLGEGTHRRIWHYFGPCVKKIVWWKYAQQSRSWEVQNYLWSKLKDPGLHYSVIMTIFVICTKSRTVISFYILTNKSRPAFCVKFWKIPSLQKIIYTLPFQHAKFLEVHCFAALGGDNSVSGSANRKTGFRLSSCGPSSWPFTLTTRTFLFFSGAVT